MTNEEIMVELGAPPASIADRCAKLASVLVAFEDELDCHQQRQLLSSYIIMEASLESGDTEHVWEVLTPLLATVELSWAVDPNGGIVWGWEPCEGDDADSVLGRSFDPDLIAQVRLEMAEGI